MKVFHHSKLIISGAVSELGLGDKADEIEKADIVMKADRVLDEGTTAKFAPRIGISPMARLDSTHMHSIPTHLFDEHFASAGAALDWCPAESVVEKFRFLFSWHRQM